MHKIFSITFLLSIIGLIQLEAQTTIGSNKNPQAGALLDLSENLNGGDNAITNSNRGLMLPRVKINDLNKLQVEGGPDLTSSEAGLHTGLTVYNINPSFDRCEPTSIPPGPYVWDGSKWVSMLGFDKHAKPIIPDPRTQDPIYNTNTYLASSGTQSTIIIPIIKALAVWEELGPNGKYKDLRGLLPEKNFTGPLKARIEWQEGLGQPGDANNPIISGTPYLSSTNINDRDAYITVNTTGNKGNAVISLTAYEGSEEVVLWSWHIWVTPPYKIQVYNGFNWMDRNLGATAASPGDNGSVGLNYQFGRHSPIATYTTLLVNGSSSSPKTTTINFPIISGSSTGVLSQNGKGQETALEYSIKNPMAIITNGNGDWYSTSLAICTDYKNRWEEIELKETCNKTETVTGYLSPITNPCPIGWKLPEVKVSTFLGLEIRTTPWPTLGNNTTVPVTSTNDGRTITTNTGDVLYYPWAGNRQRWGYAETIVGAIYWLDKALQATEAGNTSIAGDSYTFHRTNDSEIRRRDTWTGYAASVRCVQSEPQPTS